MISLIKTWHLVTKQSISIFLLENLDTRTKTQQISTSAQTLKYSAAQNLWYDKTSHAYDMFCLF